ncbi:MAG: O-antigen ligase family protein [Clostridia bacterium]|nr:O-antigen ligase family protein [Clostridia bacterium]
MPDFKSLTENRYTLNDIFVKSSEVWLAVALLCFPMAHMVHLLVFTFLDNDNINEAGFIHLLGTGEYPGDYLTTIVSTSFLFAALFGIIGIISKLVSEAKNKSLINSDRIPGIFFFVFIVLAIISVALNGISRELMFGFTVRGEGFTSILAYFLFYYIGSSVRNERIKYIIIYSILGVGLVNSVMVLVNEYIVRVPISSHYYHASVYYNVNFYAYFLTLVIMLSAALVLKDKSKGRKIFAFISLCMNTFVLVLNNTFGCFVACFVAFIIMIIADSVIKKKFSFASLGLFGVFLAICFFCGFWYRSFFAQLLGLFTDIQLIVMDDENAADAGTLRWGLWTNTIRYIKEKPIVGYGFEGICDRLLKDAEQDKVHNEYLEYAADFGIPAALCYIGGLIAVYIKALKKRAQIDGATFCCLVAAFGYIGSAFFGNTMVFIAPFFFIILGLANAIGSKPYAIPCAAAESDDTACHSEPAEESNVSEADESDTIPEGDILE